MLRCLPVLALLGCPTAPPGPPATVDTDTDTDTVDTDVPTSAWVFEPVDGMVCGGGAPTGIGVNEGTDPSKLVVFLVGGGACWDALTCFGLVTAANLEVAWGEANLQSELVVVEASGLLDRSDLDSPVHDATWIYVPYCTGDLQIGDTVRTHNPLEPNRQTHHKGDANLTAVLDRLVTAQPDVETLWVVGTSAGGFAAQLQAHRFRATWPDATMRVFADGAPMLQPGEYRWSLWQQAWDAQLPPGCPDCAASMPAVLAHQAATMPDVPFALATTTEDTIITLFLAQPIGGMNAALNVLIAEQYGAASLSVFRTPGTEHILLGNAGAWTSEDGTVLADWFDLWLNGEPLPDAP